VAQTVTVGEQKVCPESESLKFSATPTQVENPSDFDSTALLATLNLIQEESHADGKDEHFTTLESSYGPK